MLRKFAVAAAVLVFMGSIALAETIRGRITAVSDKDVTVTVGKKGDTKKKTYTISKDTKICKRKGKDDKEACKLSDLKKAIEDSKGGRGVNATLDVDGDKAKEITFGGGRRKKKADTE
jgi:hypothetical protein